ncbi:MAG: WYL domain-containing protein [Eubacterium sp.]|jgi:predicted DNA-binding transcriptional regulator YafY|nr:WYL domain-containing protein [Eubacterium sp.]MCH4046251.1 WYL domain-containing protein [Eubacterium sp.]MCH4079346.1 WYL domain-containing protein [Eubacterium sp.]MCH4110570.1 WYL domain-containing protein [Eubacterium sp.]MCI1307503.1 WYL domain-containing protein [Eubacterium sp.]
MLEKTNIKKARLLYILKLLDEKTDKDHPVTTNEILEYINSLGMTAERKTIKTDMNLLMDIGYKIVFMKSSPNRYYLEEHALSFDEMKLLKDVILSSPLLTDKEAEKLTGKIAKMGSCYQHDALMGHASVLRHAHRDESLELDEYAAVSDAIDRGKKILFRYLEYTPDKQKVLRHDGEVYKATPYAFWCDESGCHLIAWLEKLQGIAEFRAERLENVEVLDEDGAPLPEGMDLMDYRNRIFDPFNEETASVQLLCENSVMNDIIAKFGENVNTHTISRNRFQVTAAAQLGPAFYAWVFKFGGKVQIKSPKRAASEFQRMIYAQMR